MTVTSAAPTANELHVERFGVYLRVASLEQSRPFYERVLGKQPYVANDRLVAFDLAGGMLALFEDRDTQQVRGRNAVPYIRVPDANAEFDRLQRIGIRLHDQQVLVEGPITLFRFSDPDGNLLEIFSLMR
ncbi:MAG TPA: VOC family protein [Steroidobacteraceae bacterium]|jgi:catechol 2,3-dioxygenase-like lactoylglutathione lyase family enzyme|nr:VOC family protein [Steroidobacteraceae bacterium]